MEKTGEGAAPFVPDEGGLSDLQQAARSCRGCGLYQAATQTVFGDGPERARVMFVGEQPGDQEDRKGAPFVGPAGGLLDRALEEAGIDREEVYLTNAVKHFKFTPPERGKRRIHQKPNAAEVAACWPWLAAEFRVVQPDCVVCLGATAAKDLLGNSFRITKERGVLMDFPTKPELGDAPRPRFVLATTHPSAVIRSPDRQAAYRALVADLRVVPGAANGG